MNAKQLYLLEIADNAFILSHRLCEYSSRGPFLEEDLACSNVALDLIGMAEPVYHEVAKLSDDYSNGDDLAYRRSEDHYRNCLLVEQANEDFALIMTRQFFMDVYHYYLFTELTNSSDAFLKALATKSLMEVTYHLKRSSEWMIRFGGGTETSKNKAQHAINTLWRYTDELFQPSNADLALRESKVSADLKVIHEAWLQKVNEVFYLGNLKIPENKFQLMGGKQGRHSELMGHMLSDIQFLTNKYPDASW